MKTFPLIAVAGLLALAGCESRRDHSPPSPKVETQTGSAEGDARSAGEQVGAAARDVKEGADSFFHGVKEGYGGSGDEQRQSPPPTADDGRTPPTVPETNP